MSARLAIGALAFATLVGGCSRTRDDESSRCPQGWRHDAAHGCSLSRCVLATSGNAVGRVGVRMPTIAVDSAGRGVAAWLGSGGVALEVGEEIAPGSWQFRAPAGALQGISAGPQVVTGPDGVAMVAWMQYAADASAVFLSERNPRGAWTDPRSASDAFSFPTRAYEPRLAIGRDGETLFVWNQWHGEGYGVALATREAPGANWTRPSSANDVLSPPIFFSNAPQIALGPSGDAVATWYQSLGGPLRVLVSERHGRHGSFVRAEPSRALSAPDLAVDSNPVRNPVPAVGPSGEAVVVWTQEDGAGATPVYIASRQANGEWQRPSSRADRLSLAGGLDRDARAVFTPTGDLFVVWNRGSRGPDAGIYMLHRDPAGAWWPDRRGPLRLSSPGADTLAPSMAVGADGRVLVAWSEQTRNARRVVVRRSDARGRAWGPIEILSHENSEPALSPSVAIGGPMSRAVVTWIEGSPVAGRVWFAACE